MQTPTPTSNSRNFTRLHDDSAYKTHHYSGYSASVYLLRPPQSSSSSRPWIITREFVKKDYKSLLRHPLTFNPHSFNFPQELDISQLDSTRLATFYSFDEPYLADKLLLLNTSPARYSLPDGVNIITKCTVLALYGGGHLQGCPRRNKNEYWNGTNPLINLSENKNLKFDDIIRFKGDMDPDEGEGLTDGEVQSDLKDSNGKDEEEQEEMETDFGIQNQDQDGVESDLDNQNQEDGKMQCDSNRREMDAAELHVNAITEGGASLQEGLCHVSPSVFSPETGTIVTQAPSPSATENKITGTVFSLNGGNNATEEDTLRNNITELVSALSGACTFSTTVRHKSDSTTTVFEGFDIRPDLVPILQKIWQKHDNVLENSALRSDDMIARGLESLATMVHILGDNSALSLNDSQANYLVSILSDLRYIRFKVDWLIPFVEKAEKLHKSKPLVESLNNLSQLSCQAKERRAMLLDELTKLDVEENQRKEDMTKVSKMIPFFGQVKFAEPLGMWLT